jgi:hypothetical protein
MTVEKIIAKIVEIVKVVKSLPLELQRLVDIMEQIQSLGKRRQDNLGLSGGHKEPFSILLFRDR